MKWLYSMFIAVLLAVPGYVLACDISRLPFGNSIGQMVDKYHLDDLVDPNANHVEMVTRAEHACKIFPKGTVLRFVFMDNKFVQLKVEKRGEGTALFDLAMKNFGKPDREPNKAHKLQNNFQYLWGGNDPDKYVFYSPKDYSGGTMEYMEIISKKHGDLLKTLNAKAGKEKEKKKR